VPRDAFGPHPVDGGGEELVDQVLGARTHAGDADQQAVVLGERVELGGAHQLVGGPHMVDLKQRVIGDHPDPIGDPEQRRQHRMQRRLRRRPAALHQLVRGQREHDT
jgi:hypothetical protein